MQPSRAWNRIKNSILNSPIFKEYLQKLTIEVLNTFIIYLGFPIAVLVLGYLFLYTRWWILTVLYLAWMYYDRHTPFKGGRKLNWFRKLRIFHYYKEYFPTKLIKTVELPPEKNYLLIAYPHGIIPFGAFSSFATEANKVESEVFPGLDAYFITTSYFYAVPFVREYYLSLGGCGSTEAGITYLLESGPSKAVVLVAGGGSEAALAYPGSTYRIIRRKGFIRVALKTGTSLVPMFSFGQNNTHELGEIRAKWLLYFADKFHQITRITLVNIKGRGFIQNSFGPFPRRTVINVVVGKPIDLPKVENPSQELIDEYHGKFFQALEDLFEENKSKYDVAGKDAKLIML